MLRRAQLTRLLSEESGQDGGWGKEWRGPVATRSVWMFLAVAFRAQRNSENATPQHTHT